MRSNKTLLLAAVVVSMVSLAIVGTIIGCDSGGNPAPDYENTAVKCSDGIDNYLDHFTDCDDFNCDGFCA